jgi:uncharacterized membrane protein YvbJ
MAHAVLNRNDSSMKTCKKCISENTDEAECCLNCGAKFPNYTDVDSSGSSDASQAIPKKRAIIFVVILVVFLIIVFACFMLYDFQKFVDDMHNLH